MRFKAGDKVLLFPNEFKDITVSEFGQIVNKLDKNKKLTDKDIFSIFCNTQEEEFNEFFAKDVSKVLSKLNWLDTLVDDCAWLLKDKKKYIFINDRRFNYKHFKTSNLTIGNIATIEEVIKEKNYTNRVCTLVSELIKGDDSLVEYLKTQPCVNVIPLFNFFLKKLQRTQLASLKK